MGQTRPVSIYRLISKGSIEEAMWQLTQEKLKLEKEITNEGMCVGGFFNLYYIYF